MAVNYGLGGFGDGPAFMNVYTNAQSNISITGVGLAVQFISMTEKTLGTGAGTPFDNTYHRIKFNRGDIVVKATGVYFITYNVTTSGASNDNLEWFLQIKIPGGAYGGAYGIQKVYSRAGDMYETGSQVALSLNDGDSVGLFVKNISDTSDITLDNANVSICKLNYF